MFIFIEGIFIVKPEGIVGRLTISWLIHEISDKCGLEQARCPRKNAKNLVLLYEYIINHDC